ncbi:MAG: hypothetical protein HYZ42_04550 [Bacteroidetes bacterium]|nr:hypothetical protein [Bacteroidota bacterium]
MFFSQALFSQSKYEIDKELIDSKLESISQAENIVLNSAKDVSINDFEASTFNHLLKYNNPNDSNNKFTFDDFQFKWFGLGLCCWQYGAIYLLVKKDTDRNQKVSFCIGFGTNLTAALGLIIIPTISLGDINFSVF